MIDIHISESIKKSKYNDFKTYKRIWIEQVEYYFQLMAQVLVQLFHPFLRLVNT